ncbi:hypothetical protein [Prescottella equi]|uniref:hypothetical protein n=1 Tax=Rhodococcus hoagii TaxID=43767 RepID=UPI0007CD4119|nr:hypothetical protein [Prescottella equi]
MKGKYAAKAKNRLANLDNEILQEVVAERDILKMERDALARELSEVERDVNARAMRKAGELASAEVESLQEGISSVRAAAKNERDGAAKEVFATLGRHGIDPGKIPGFAVELAVALKFDGHIVDLLAEVAPNSRQLRKTRRASNARVARNRLIHGEVEIFGVDQADWDRR